jgi:hypothetical protein
MASVHSICASFKDIPYCLSLENVPIVVFKKSIYQYLRNQNADVIYLAERYYSGTSGPVQKLLDIVKVWIFFRHSDTYIFCNHDCKLTLIGSWASSKLKFLDVYPHLDLSPAKRHNLSKSWGFLSILLGVKIKAYNESGLIIHSFNEYICKKSVPVRVPRKQSFRNLPKDSILFICDDVFCRSQSHVDEISNSLRRFANNDKRLKKQIFVKMHPRNIDADKGAEWQFPILDPNEPVEMYLGNSNLILTGIYSSVFSDHDTKIFQSFISSITPRNEFELDVYSAYKTRLASLKNVRID